MKGMKRNSLKRMGGLALLLSSMSLFFLMTAEPAAASTTIPQRGTFISPTDPHIQYTGRISFHNPERPMFNYPGTQIAATFTGTSIKLVGKPHSGYYMAQIDQAEPFKVALSGERDSVVTLATALPYGQHTVRLMYIIEGFDLRPEFWGFIVDPGCTLVDTPALPTRKIEYVGNSITCGYGNESMVASDPFEYETENHYYTYAALTSRALNAQHWVVARSGIGAYRNYNGPRTGNPDNRMTAQYEYTMYAEQSAHRKRSPQEGERWDFSRYQPDVVCINLGTNDLSTPNYDLKLLKQGYKDLLAQVRRGNPKAAIVFLSGSMLGGKELELCKQTLNEVMDEAHKNGDKRIYRFDFSPQTGDLKFGASWHPSLWQHEKMAGELTAYLRTLMKWF